MIKQLIICVPLVLAGAAPPVPQGRAFDGNGAGVGRQRPAFHCYPVCDRTAQLMPPALPGPRPALETPPVVPVNEPAALALFGVAVAGLVMARRRA